MYITITSSAETVILAAGKRKRINHWISMLQLAASSYRNYIRSSIFHHRTFAQNLSHPSEPSLPYTTLILWTLIISCLVANSHLEKQNSKQIPNKQIISWALTSKRHYLVEFGFCSSLCIIKICSQKNTVNLISGSTIAKASQGFLIPFLKHHLINQSIIVTHPPK